MTDTGTEYRPPHIAEKELNLPSSDDSMPKDIIADLVQRVIDLEGVVSHMVHAISAFAEVYAKRDLNEPELEKKASKPFYFIAIPTLEGLYLETFIGSELKSKVQQPSLSYDNALIVQLLDGKVTDICHVMNNIWTAIPEVFQAAPVAATPGLIERANQLVREYENSLSS